MKQSDVMVGGFYTARVSGNMVVVRIDASLGHRAFGAKRAIWQATNLATGKVITVSAARLQRRVGQEAALAFEAKYGHKTYVPPAPVD